MPVQKGIKPIAQNRKARHDYFIESTYECGIELVGTEVKSIRAGKVNLKDSYAQVKGGEAFVIGMHVSPYEQGNIFNRDPFRPRRHRGIQLPDVLRKCLPMAVRRRRAVCNRAAVP